jgi:hypothetical protein
MMEIALATAVSPRTILLTRLSLLFAIDLILGLIASVVLANLHTEISLWPLVNTWLAPMACLSALALLVTTLATEPLLAVLISLGLWGLQTIRQFPSIIHLPAYIPNLLLLA